MDLKSLSTDEIRSMDSGGAREAELAIRRRMSDIKMDIYTPKSQNSAEFRALKRNLARLLTVKNQAKAAKKAKA